MKRTAKRIIVAAAVAAVSIQSVPVASACGGRGRPSGGYARPAYSQPVYSQPAYSQPVYSRPSYAQPVYGQPAYGQPAYRNPAQPVQVVRQRPVAPTTAAAVQPRPRALVAAQTAATARPVSVQTAAPQAVAPQTVTARPVTAQRVTTQPVAARQVTAQSAATADAEISALAALASIATAQPTAPATQPAAQPAAQPTTQPAVPQFSAVPTAASSTAAPHVGSFQANLPSNVTIELNLDNGGTFSWVVRNNGKTTQFSGQYRVTQGRLTLVRSNDLQQMAGKLTSAQNGFTFKLDGGNSGGLNFKKV